MNLHEKINYVEFPTTDMNLTKQFFADVFNRSFTDYGDNYSAFHGAGIDGGFFPSEKPSLTDNGSTLMVFYSHTLEDTQKKITHAGGRILQDIFSFPGGRRFHFCDPGGNEFAVWSDKE